MFSTLTRAQVITTVAGSGQDVVPGDGGSALNAGINEPQGIVVDGKGNIFFWDSANFRVREVSAGIITTAADNGMVGNFFLGNLGDGGPATSASLGGGGMFGGVAMDGAGNLYICDPTNNRVRKVNAAGIRLREARRLGVGATAAWPPVPASARPPASLSIAPTMCTSPTRSSAAFAR
jgi:hypothetical protein